MEVLVEGSHLMGDYYPQRELWDRASGLRYVTCIVLVLQVALNVNSTNLWAGLLDSIKKGGRGLSSRINVSDSRLGL